MTSLAPRIQAAAALGTGLLVIGIPLSLLLIPAWQGRVEFRERRAVLEEQYSRYAALAAQTPQLKQSVGWLLTRSADRSGFLQESSLTLASAALQKKIQTLIENHGGTLQSAQSVPVESKAMFPPVKIRIQAQLALEGLEPVLSALARDTLLLEVDNLFIQSRNTPRGRANKGGGPNILETRLDVTAYLFEAEEP